MSLTLAKMAPDAAIVLHGVARLAALETQPLGAAGFLGR
jgi:hypothetical protein